MPARRDPRAAEKGLRREYSSSGRPRLKALPQKAHVRVQTVFRARVAGLSFTRGVPGNGAAPGAAARLGVGTVTVDRIRENPIRNRRSACGQMNEQSARAPEDQKLVSERQSLQVQRRARASQRTERSEQG